MSINHEDYQKLNNDEILKEENKIIKAIKRIFGIFLIVLSIFIGIFLSNLILLVIAEKTKSAIFAFIIQFLFILIFTGGLSYLGTFFIRLKAKNSLITSLIIFLLTWGLTFICLCVIFYSPVDNNTIYYTNINNTYWELNTGSKISYIKYEGKTMKEYPIIFLHGGPSSPVNGKECFVDELVSEGYVLYQYDQFGCGNSNRAKNPKEYTVERHVNDLEEIRKHIGAEKIILISRSWGGELASSYMAKYNNKVYISIFISPGPIWEKDNSYERLTKEGENDINNIKRNNLRYQIVQILTNFGSKIGLYYIMSENKLDKLFMNFHDELNMKPGSGKYFNSKGGGYGFWGNLMTKNSRAKQDCIYEKLLKSDAKCLVIKGQYDYISFGCTVLYRDKIKDSILILVDGMGHCIEKEYTSMISENIISFLKNGTTISEPYKGKKNPWK